MFEIPREYIVTLKLPIVTGGGVQRAKRIFTHMVKSDPNMPLLHLKVKQKKL